MRKFTGRGWGVLPTDHVFGDLGNGEDIMDGSYPGTEVGNIEIGFLLLLLGYNVVVVQLILE